MSPGRTIAMGRGWAATAASICTTGCSAAMNRVASVRFSILKAATARLPTNCLLDCFAAPHAIHARYRPLGAAG